MGYTMSNYDVTIKELVNNQKIKGLTRYEFNIKGKDVSTALVNTLRRTLWSDIPVFYFDKIKILLNTSIYNNDYLTLRIKNIPIINIENKEVYCEKIFSENFLDNTIIENENTIDIDKTILSNLTIYCNVENKDNELMNVTTDHCKFYYKQSEIKSPYPKPILIIVLKPNQKINFSAISIIGCERISAEQSAVSVCGYKEIK